MMKRLLSRMSGRAWLLAGLLAALLIPLALLARPEQAGIRSEILLRTGGSWDGVPYGGYPAGAPEITVRHITAAAHSVLNWHTHPMPNAAYVVSGEITVETRGGKSQRFTAGQVIAETVDTVHRGLVGEQPVELVVFYAGVKDQPIAQEAK